MGWYRFDEGCIEGNGSQMLCYFSVNVETMQNQHSQII